MAERRVVNDEQMLVEQFPVQRAGPKVDGRALRMQLGANGAHQYGRLLAPQLLVPAHQAIRLDFKQSKRYSTVVSPSNG